MGREHGCQTMVFRTQVNFIHHSPADNKVNTKPSYFGLLLFSAQLVPICICSLCVTLKNESRLT